MGPNPRVERTCCCHGRLWVQNCVVAIRLWCQVFTNACLEGVFENMKGASLSMASGVKVVSCRRTVWRQDRLQKKRRRVTIAKRGILGVSENDGFSHQIIPF